MTDAIQRMNYEELRRAEITATVAHRIRSLQVAIEKLNPALSKEWETVFDKMVSEDSYLTEIQTRMMLIGR